MKNLLLAAFSAATMLSVTAVKAQSADDEKQPSANAGTQTTGMMGMGGKTIAGTAGIQVVYRNYNFDQINTALNANGIPSLDNGKIWINLTMDHIHGNWIFQDGIGATPLTTSRNNNYKASFGQANAFFRAGYNIAKNSPVSFYPFAGINFTGAMLHIKDEARVNSTNNFTSGLLASTSSKTFYQGNFGIDLGAGLDYGIKLKTKTTDCVTIERSIPIGIRAGYYINASQGDWKFEDHTVGNAPDKKQSAVFIALNIGLGYRINKR